MAVLQQVEIAGVHMQAPQAVAEVLVKGCALAQQASPDLAADRGRSAWLGVNGRPVRSQPFLPEREADYSWRIRAAMSREPWSGRASSADAAFAATSADLFCDSFQMPSNRSTGISNATIFSSIASKRPGDILCRVQTGLGASR